MFPQDPAPFTGWRQLEFLGRGKSRVVFAESEAIVLKLAEQGGHGIENQVSLALPTIFPRTWQAGTWMPGLTMEHKTEMLFVDLLRQERVLPLDEYLIRHEWSTELLLYIAIVISKASEQFKLRDLGEGNIAVRCDVPGGHECIITPKPYVQ